MGNCFIEALANQTRYDPIHSAMAFNHQSLRQDVVEFVPEMLRYVYIFIEYSSIHFIISEYVL